MKKLILLLFFVIGATLSSQAQCVADSSFQSFGFYPLPDTANPLFSDPTIGINDTACVGQMFEFDWTAVIPDTLPGEVIEPIIGFNIDVPLKTVRLLGINGFDQAFGVLSDIDVNVICDTPGCTYNPVAGSQTYGCIRINGTPPAAGDYELILDVEITVTLFGSDITQAVTSDQFTNGQYIVRVLDAASSFCSPSSNQNITETFSVSQNSPNPFSSVTSIEIQSPKSGDYDFRVYNLIGKVVHEQKLDIMPGKNTIQFDGNMLKPGIYLYSIGNEEFTVTKRMMVTHP